MSTPCNIAILNKDGTVSSIRCFYDGYILGGVGEMLHSYYKTCKAVSHLIMVGDIEGLFRTVWDTSVYAVGNKGRKFNDVNQFAEYTTDCINYLYNVRERKWYVLDALRWEEGEMNLLSDVILNEKRLSCME